MKTIYDFTKLYQDACKIGRVVSMETQLTWNDFLEGFPEEQRQFWRCNTCKQWFDTFGSMVVVNDDAVEPVFWQPVEGIPQELVGAFEHLRTLVKAYVAKEGKLVPFTTNTAYLRKATTSGRVGVAERGGYNHFFFEEGQFPLNRRGTLEVRTKYENVRHRLTKTLAFKDCVERIEQAVAHLKVSQYAKARKDAETVEAWLLDPLHRIRAGETVSKVLLSMSDDQIGYLNGFADSAVSNPVLGYAEMGQGLEQLADQYFEMIDPENFRKTKREASEQAVKLVVEKIRNEGTDKALTVRFAKLEEINIKFPIKRHEVVVEVPKEQAPARSLLAAAEDLLESKTKEPVANYWDAAPGQKAFDGTGEKIGMRKFLQLVKEHDTAVTMYVPHTISAGAWMTHDEAPEANYPWRWNIQKEPAAFSWVRPLSINHFGIPMGWAGVIGVTHENFGGDEKLCKELNEGRLQIVIDGDADYKRTVETDFQSPSPYLTEYLNKDYYEHHRALNDLGQKTPMQYNGEPFYIGIAPNGSAFLARVKLAGLIRYYEVCYSDAIEDLSAL